MCSSLQTANYRCFLLITGKPVESENRQINFEVQFFLATPCKKPFLGTCYGFCSRGGGAPKKIVTLETFEIRKSSMMNREQIRSRYLLRKLPENVGKASLI